MIPRVSRGGRDFYVVCPHPRFFVLFSFFKESNQYYELVNSPRHPCFRSSPLCLDRLPEGQSARRQSVKSTQGLFAPWPSASRPPQEKLVPSVERVLPFLFFLLRSTLTQGCATTPSHAVIVGARLRCPPSPAASQSDPLPRV